MRDTVVERLSAIGYEAKESDEPSLAFCIEKAIATVLNETNLMEIPEKLIGVTIDIALGEFLLSKKTFSRADLEKLNLEMALKSITLGDATTTFSDKSLTEEERLDNYINHLLEAGKTQFSAYRRIKW